ncbi:LOW QUALITY PROTEIN: tubulin epsilon and delta complex protein 1 [Trematomus bernacchii]|uniref:LOW QUALITY PROTEIN: tubulin epsilon and delta complex protein 1 n=1 Tax=Trematomus bernacchii TaxID=40690 RepID=UPI00146B55AE|nr:LOW QUALITY PROTEIN: tubulin epsilon and delta complex protein 1 [Trematomus bernacchii]
MQRSAAAVSVEVKQVIAALCRLLAATGLECVPAPEHFRRAKFGGGPAVEDQFWQLLANIQQKCGFVSCEARSQLGGATELRRLVAAGLWQTGYHADWMYERGGREGGEGGRYSSKDLLLALGWLLATGTLEKLLTQRVEQLDKTLILTPSPVNHRLPTELPLDSASLRRLQWLVGSLRHQGRTLLSMQEERTCLLHAVSVASLPSSVSPSSSDQSSTLLRKDCVCLQQLCDLLEAYLNWRQVEKVFWTWMDSVVDGHLTDPVHKKPTVAPNGRAGGCHHGNCGLEKLDDMLLRLPTRQKGQGRVREAPEGRGEGGLLQGRSDSCLPPLSAPPRLPCCPLAYRLQTERPVRHSSPPADGARGGTPTAGGLSASQAVELLLQTEALLLERRGRQRLANRTQLQEMIGRLDELVLIPP